MIKKRTMKMTDESLKLFCLFLLFSLLLFPASGCSERGVPDRSLTAEELKEEVLENPQETPKPYFPEDMFDRIKPRPGPENNAVFVSVRMFQFGFDPEVIKVKKGERIILTITSADVGHGFALPEYGINERIPPQESVSVEFTADQEGEFRFFESVYSGKGWKDMEGVLVVGSAEETSPEE